MPVMTAGEMAAALDLMEQNDGAGPLIATRVLIRPVTGCGDPRATEAITVKVYQRCVRATLTQFGTDPAAGRYARLATRDESELPLTPTAAHVALADRLARSYEAQGWAEVQV